MRRIGLALLAGALLWPGQGWAQQRCDSPTRPWVRFVLEPRPWVDAIAERLLKHLRAQLAPRIDVCLEGNPQTAVASVQITPLTASVFTIAIEVSDQLTHKRVSRTVELGTIPEDARALTIAIGATELLRASWAELRLSTAARAQPVPPAVAQTIEAIADDNSTAATAWPSRAEISASISYQAWSGGLRFYGPDAVAAVAVSSRLKIALGVGLRLAVPINAPHGQIQITAVRGTAGASFTLTPVDARVGLDAVCALDGQWVWFTAKPVTGATDHPANTGALLLGGGLSGWFKPGSVWVVRLELGAQGALRPMEATDDGASVGGIFGLGAYGRLAVGMTF
jgi:hypothetical protein